MPETLPEWVGPSLTSCWLEVASKLCKLISGLWVYYRMKYYIVLYLTSLHARLVRVCVWEKGGEGRGRGKDPTVFTVGYVVRYLRKTFFDHDLHSMLTGTLCTDGYLTPR